MSSKERKEQLFREGRCITCGKVNDREGYQTCSVCSDKANARKRARYAERKQQGLCVSCGKPTERNISMCDDCSQKEYARIKENRIALKRLGFCIVCGHEKAMSGKSLCADCFGKRDENRRKYYLDHKEKYNRERYSKEKHSNAVKDGICTRCYKRKARTGYKTCLECYTRDRKTQLKRGRGVSYQFALENGLCTACRKEKATHGKVCESCYEKNMRNFAKRTVTSNKYWADDNRLLYRMTGRST